MALSNINSRVLNFYNSRKEAKQLENSIQKLLEIQNAYSSKEVVSFPANATRFTIDWDARTITIPTGRTVLAVLNDHCAEVVVFETDRFYNGHDLSEEICIIQYAVATRRSGQYINEGYYPVTMIDTSDPDKLLFAWEIKNSVTNVSGVIDFAVRFYSIDQFGDEPEFDYNLNTLASTMVIKNTLNTSNEGVSVEPGELESLTDKFYDLSKSAENSAKLAASASQIVVESLETFQEYADVVETNKKATDESAAKALESEKNVNNSLQELKNGIANGEFKGEKGDVGPQGEQGPQGVPGERGPAGADGKDAVVDPTLSHEGEAADAKATGMALAQKLTKPDAAPTAGQTLRIKSVNEDGTFVCEWADAEAGGVTDVQVAGQSVVSDGVAELPIISPNRYGLVYGLSHFFTASSSGWLDPKAVDSVTLQERCDIHFQASRNRMVTGGTIDLAVKAAMCDGKGAAWSADEQAAAIGRIGVDEQLKGCAYLDLVAEVVLTEKTQDVIITADKDGDPLNIADGFAILIKVPTDGTVMRWGFFDGNDYTETWFKQRSNLWNVAGGTGGAIYKRIFLDGSRFIQRVITTHHNYGTDFCEMIPVYSTIANKICTAHSGDWQKLYIQFDVTDTADNTGYEIGLYKLRGCVI